jgi:Ca2+-dependent lipid-binding protein
MSETKKVEEKKGASTLPRGVLELTFHEGKELRDVQTLGKQDPYVKVKIGKKDDKTKEDNNGGKKPNWKDAKLSFSLKGADNEIEAIVTVVDLNPISDTNIGTVTIPVLELCKTQPKKKWIQVTHGGKLAGEICFSAAFIPALVFTFTEAKNLHDTNVIAKMDPYVKVTIGKKQKEETKPHVDGGKNPKWKDAVLIFNRPLDDKPKKDQKEVPEPTFDFIVMHDGSLSDDMLGHTTLTWSAAQAVKGKGAQWHQLKRSKGDAKDGGQLLMRVADFSLA